MLTRLPLPIAASLVFACGAPDVRESDDLSVRASAVDQYRADFDLAFAVGLRTELRVYGSRRGFRDIRSVRCPDGSCTVETNSSAAHPRYPVFLVTPHAPTFNVHVELVDEDGPPSFDATVTAVDGAMVALHRGAGPGVPFLEGTSVVWYLGTRARRVAWDASRSEVSVTPPFELVNAPQIGSGPDQDPFIRVQVRAPATLEGATATGTLTHTNGSATTSFPLVATRHDEIRKLHVAPAPHPERDEADPPLAATAADRISISPARTQTVWVVFETRGGAFGIAGAGESLPAPGATFGIRPYSPAFYSFDIPRPPFVPSAADEPDPAIPSLEDQPILDLEGLEVGLSRLVLNVGKVSASADVFVTNERP